jgi:translation initiation factor 2 gamma subunit (eIF-2gamma)
MKKKIMIIGHVDHGRTCLQSAIESVLEKERGITIVTNNHEIKDVMRSEWLLKNEVVEPLITATENYFEKPKSKYHK